MKTTFQKPKKDIYKEKSSRQSGATKRSITSHERSPLVLALRRSLMTIV